MTLGLVSFSLVIKVPIILYTKRTRTEFFFFLVQTNQTKQTDRSVKTPSVIKNLLSKLNDLFKHRFILGGTDNVTVFIIESLYHLHSQLHYCVLPRDGCFFCFE